MAKYTKRKDGRYETKVDIGYTEDGKRNRVAVYGHSVRELDEKVTELKLKIKQGYVNRNDITFYDYSKEWLETYKNNLAWKTQKKYKQAVVHLNKQLKYIKMRDIVSSDVQKVINSNYDHPSACKDILLTMRQINKLAIKDRLMIDDVCSDIKPPKCPKPIKRALTQLEIKTLFKADMKPQDAIFVKILYYFGLRREEALALQRTDFDFKSNMLHVKRALQVGDTLATTKIKNTKSEAGVRDIPIPNAFKRDLRAFINSSDNLYLFTTKEGNLYADKSYRRMWERIIKSFNATIPNKLDPFNGLTAHIFRHNYATMLYYSGVSIKKAAQLMGHSDIKVIMEIYAHLDDTKEKIEDKVNKMFG